MAKLSVVILSYNTCDTTVACVQSVLSSINFDQSLQAEIMVIDNNSSDNSVRELKKIKDDRLIIVESKENLGYSKGNNVGAQKSSGEIIIFLNSDTIALEDAIPRLYSYFISQKTYQFIGAQLLNHDMSLQPSAGRFYTLPVACAALFLKGDAWGASRWPVRKIQKVDWVSGAAFITQKNTFNQLGGFNESLFMYWDEIDLFYRASQQHMSVGTYPDAKIIHLEGASSKSRTQPIVKVFQGYLYFYKKHYSPLHVRIIRFMLQLKSSVALIIGKMTNNHYLIDTYSQAYEIAKKN